MAHPPRLTSGFVPDFSRAAGADTLIAAGMHLLTPPVRALYAILIQAGLVVADDGSAPGDD